MYVRLGKENWFNYIQLYFSFICGLYNLIMHTGEKVKIEEKNKRYDGLIC